MAVKTIDQILKETGTSVNDIKSITADIDTTANADPAKKSFLETINERRLERAGNLAERIDSGQGFGSTLLQSFGQGAGLAGDIVGEGINRATFGVIPQLLQKGAEAFPEVADAGKSVMDAYASWKEQNPEAAANLESVVNIASIAPIGAGAKVGAQGVKSGVSATTRAAVAATGAVADVARPVLETAGTAAKTIGNAATMAVEGAARIPGRLATNVAESVATREAINALPTKVAQTAVRDGININDVKLIYDIPATQKVPARELVQSVVDYVDGASKTNPIEVVGKPIVERIKFLNKQRGTIGQKLGEVADTLPNVTKEELSAPVFDSLKSVSGLNGLKIGSDGLLDFTDTVLATAATKSDRVAIQNIFNDAIKAGTGKQKHLLRQELFEVIGGKKNAGKALTDTQEKAFDAIRKGLSDVLDSKNADYKKLSSQYRAVTQPLNDIKKFMRSAGYADEDILNMSAGLLARRLTSNAVSNPQIKNILRAMDKVAVKGKTLPNVEMLQTLYNLLDKYYDIAGKTTLQGQTSSAIGKSGIKDFISQSVSDMAGRTPAVQRKALEEALFEALQ